MRALPVDLKPAALLSDGMDTGAFPRVYVGRIVQVQANVGGGYVTMTAYRVNGRQDILLREGEEMRNVLPQIRWDMFFPSAAAQPEGPLQGGGAPKLAGRPWGTLQDLQRPTSEAGRMPTCGFSAREPAGEA